MFCFCGTRRGRQFRLSAPPPPPLGPGNSVPAVRLKSEVADRRPEPPLCVQNAMMTKDKKPFTYTPGGIDLSEIKSPRMVRRLEHNANAPGVGEMPRSPQGHTGSGQSLPPSALAAMQPALPVQVFPAGPPPPPPPPPPPTQPLPTKAVATNEGVFERPDMTKIIPENPMALLKKTPRVERRSFLDELNDTSNTSTNGTAKQPVYCPQPQATPQPQAYTPQPQGPVPYSPQAQVKPFSPQPQSPAQYSQQPQAYAPQPQYSQQPQPYTLQPQYSPQPINSPQQHAKPFSPQPAQYSPQAEYGKPQSYTPQPPSPQYSPQPMVSPQPQAKPFSPQPTMQQPRPYAPQPQYNPQPQHAPQPQYRPQPQPPTPPHKGNSNVGSLYIPPINQVQVQAQPSVETPPPTPPQRQPQSQQTPQSPIPKLNAAPKPWQNQKKEPELPPWAQRPPEEDGVGFFQPPARVTPVQMQPPPPRPGVEVVWVTQPEVYQHPGPGPNQRWVQRPPPQQQQQQQQPPQQQQQPHTRIIPIQIEGGTPQQAVAPGTPTNDRSMNRQQSWTPNQSNSFKILQKMTSTDGEDDGGQSNGQQHVVEHGPRTAQQFQQPPPLNDQFRKMNVGESERDFMNRVKQDSSYDEENPRYRGGLIPSRVFRLLDESVPPSRSPQVRTIPVQIEGEEPSQPYVHPSQQTVQEPKKYMGTAIPSRAFKMVQAMTSGQQLGPDQSDL